MTRFYLLIPLFFLLPSSVVQAGDVSTSTHSPASDYIQQYLKSLKLVNHDDIDMSKLALEHDWKISLHDGTLSHDSVPSDRLMVKGKVLATYHTFDKTLKWAWANPNTPTHLKIHQDTIESKHCLNKNVIDSPTLDLNKTEAEFMIRNVMYCAGYADVLSGKVGTLSVYVLVSQPLPLTKSQQPNKIYYKIVP